MILWNRILVGLEDSKSSLAAVRYLTAVLGGSPNCQIHLLAVFHPPVGENPAQEEERRLKAKEKRANLHQVLAKAREMLLQANFPFNNLSMEMVESKGQTVSQVIMAQQRKGGFGTVVLGRRGLSKAEEFLYGSVSSKVMHQTEGFALWVVS